MKRIIYNPELKETIHFLKLSEETNGQYSELEISLEPGGGNPMHYHKSYSELFTAVQGELGMELAGGQIIVLIPGESHLVEKGVSHRFLNPGDIRITFTNRVVPGSKGLEDTLRILCGLAADGKYSGQKIPKNILDMGICAELSDVRLTGIKGVITTPLVKLFAAIARLMGVDVTLKKKYCV